MGANLQYKGIQEVLDNIGSSKKKKDEGPSKEEVNSEWRRLASFMVGKT